MELTHIARLLYFLIYWGRELSRKSLVLVPDPFSCPIIRMVWLCKTIMYLHDMVMIWIPCTSWSSTCYIN